MRKGITVGSVLRLSVPCLGNPKGTLGLCIEDYNDGQMFIFPNGNYDGFGNRFDSTEVEDFFDLDYDNFCYALSNYQFTNVMKLSRDFSLGLFSEVWK